MIYVFASYARSAADESQTRFIEDVRARIVAEFKCRPDEAVFVDRQTLQLGQDWEREIERALSVCKIFVALLSPGYVASDHCGREWGAFLERLEARAGAPAPLLLPVIWQPVELPLSVTRFQHSNDALGTLYAHNGLRYVMHLDNEEYQRFLDAFCRYLHTTILCHGIADASPLIALAHARSPFRLQQRRPWKGLGVRTALLAALAAALGLGVIAWHVQSDKQARAGAARTRATNWLEESAKYSSEDLQFAMRPPNGMVRDLVDEDLYGLIREWTPRAPGAVRALLDEAVGRDHDPPRVMLLDGIWYLDSKHPQQALERFNGAIQHGAGAEAFHERAKAKFQLLDESGSRDDMTRACHLGDTTACGEP